MTVQDVSPILKGLRAGWSFTEPDFPFFDGRGFAFNSAGRPLNFLEGTGSAVPKIPGPVGGALDWVSGHGTTRPPAQEVSGAASVFQAGSTTFSMAFLAWLDATGTGQVLCQAGDQFVVRADAGGTLEVLLDPGDGFDTFLTSLALVTGDWALYGVTWDGVNLRAYVNALTEATVVAAAPGLKPAATLRFGDNNDAQGQQWVGRLALAYFYNRVLSSEEFALIESLLDTTAPSDRQTRELATLANSQFPGILVVERGANQFDVLEKRPDNRARSPILATPSVKRVDYNTLRAILDPSVLTVLP